MSLRNRLWLWWHSLSWGFPLNYYYVGSGERKVLELWILFYCPWFQIHWHRINCADAPGCYHSHPATAWRVVLWGGYVEEVYDEATGQAHRKRIRPGHVSQIVPDFVHRIDAVKTSYSLWFRGPIVKDTRLVGTGWPPQEPVYNEEYDDPGDFH